MSTYLIAKFVHFMGMFLWISGIFAWMKAAKIFMQAQEDGKLDRSEILPHMRPVHIFAMHLGMGLTLAGGFTMLGLQPGWMQAGWLHAKLLIVAWIVFLTIVMTRRSRQWAAGTEIALPTWLRTTGKVLILLLLLAVFRPF